MAPKLVHLMPARADGTVWEMARRTVCAAAGAGVDQLVLSATPPSGLPDTVPTEPVATNRKPAFLARMAIKRAARRFGADCLLIWQPGCPAEAITDLPVLLFRRFPVSSVPATAANHHVAVPTDVLRRELMDEGWPAGHMDVVPDFPLADAVPAVDRRTYYTPDKVPLILVTGDWRIGEGGVETLLRGVERVPNAYIWFVGGGPEKDKVATAAQEIGVKPRLRLIDWPENLAAHYAACDLVINPYGRDMTHRPVVDAWAQGKPVIAMDAKGPGLLITHRENGMLVPPGEIRVLTDTIKRLLADPERCAALAEAGRRTLAQQPDAGKVLGRLLEVVAGLGETGPTG